MSGGWKPARVVAALPLLPVGDPGPDGAGRGAVEMDLVRSGGRQVQVARRRVGCGLRALTVRQREAAAAYAGLVERICAIRGPVECGRRAGVSDGGAVARMADVERLRRVRAAIGDGVVALSTRGQSDRPPGNPVLLVALVHRVCVDGLSLEAVLAAHGWPRTRCALDRLAEALRGAVDSMAPWLPMGD